MRHIIWVSYAIKRRIKIYNKLSIFMSFILINFFLIFLKKNPCLRTRKIFLYAAIRKQEPISFLFFYEYYLIIPRLPLS